MIAVVGATGNIGRVTVKELRALGEAPLCVVRNPEKAREVLGADAKTAVAERSDRAALEKALKGADRVYVVTGASPQLGELEMTVLEAAEAVGAKYFVKLSGGKAMAQPDSETPLGRGHYMVEQALKKSALEWVILRPGLFMQNTLGQAPLIKAESKMAMPYAKDLPLPFIDTRDIGAVSARVVREPAKFAGQEIAFTGAVSSYGAFANVLSEVLGKPITYIEVAPEQAEKAMKARGMPDWLVGHMLTIAKLAKERGFSAENSQIIRDIVGREPITIRQFAQDHKAAFT